ncbi:MAG: LysR family transcriptional regulator [Proteobacteria bacterium]|nr:LysR family transcriptional regulator [Pseudomonadota bacterium]MBS0572225.1 LysR family transcriptional regulator [Pseudomonadota bacterium]
MIRIEALRTFAEVAEHGNIRDAAAKLCRTPSALSMTLKQVEDLLGVPLFETDRKSSLTDSGRFLLETARVLLRDYDRAMELVADHAQAKSGRLRLAAVPSVAAMLLPEALRGFLADRPGVGIELIDTDSTDVRLMVETGQVDMGIAGAIADHPGLEFEALFSDPFLLICRAESPPGQQGRPLEWEDLAGLPLILNEATRGLGSAGFQELAGRARLSVRNVTSLIALVQSGMGVTLLPALATMNLPGTLSARQIADPACRRQVGLYQRGGRIMSPLGRAFRAHFGAFARGRAQALGLAVL